MFDIQTIKTILENLKADVDEKKKQNNFKTR